MANRDCGFYASSHGWMELLVRFSNNTALILPPEAYQGQSEISPLARFTLRWRQEIGVLKPHPKASVNGASVLMRVVAVSLLATPPPETRRQKVCCYGYS